MKRFIILLTAGAIALNLVACDSQSTAPEKSEVVVPHDGMIIIVDEKDVHSSNENDERIEINDAPKATEVDSKEIIEEELKKEESVQEEQSLDRYKENAVSVENAACEEDVFSIVEPENTPSNAGSRPLPDVSNEPNYSVHTCEYMAESVTLGNCTSYTTYACSCGDWYNDDYTGGKGHQWTEVREDVPIYETVCFTRCGYCHADITGNVSAHVKEEALAGNGSRSYQSYEQVQIGIENQVVGYTCGVCGTDK